VVLLFLLIAAPLASHVAFPVLAAVLLWVCYGMGDWRAFREMPRYTPLRNMTLIVTFALTVLFNITVAVEIGMLLAAFLLIKRLTEAASVRPIVDLAKDADAPALPLPEATVALRLRGALFFGVAEKIENALQVPSAAKVVILDMFEVIYIDTNVADLLQRFVQRELTQGREVVVLGLSEQAESLFQRTGLISQLGRDRITTTRRQALELAKRRSRNGP